MKIGILTFANVSNFGANLQALSTVSYFQNLGHQAYVIDWSPKDFRARFQKFETEQQKAHKQFFEQLIPHTQTVENDIDIAMLLDEENFDAIVVGSDAVLQDFPFLSRFHFPTSTIYRIDQITSDRLFPNAFWGSFNKYIKRDIPIVLMSGSCQNTKYKNILRKERKQMCEALKKFSYISVRDEWTKKMLSYCSYGDIEAPITPDPVFAFNYNYSQTVTRDDIIEKFKLPQNYILFSYKKPENVNYEWLCEVKEQFKQKGFECVAFPMPDGIVFRHPFDYEIQPPLNPLDWYNLIRFSNGYIGENMHPVVVCLHNGTPVFSFDSYGARKYRFFVDDKSSKVYDIMNIFGLADHRVRVKTIVPAAELVEKILNFESEKCKEIAAQRYELYKKMMLDITEAISSKNGEI